MRNLQIIPDTNFRNRLKDLFPKAFENELLDVNNNEIINCDRLDLYRYGIRDLTGIEWFVNLKYLYCYSNGLTFLPNLPDTLEYLACYNNRLTTLPELPNTLKELWCSNNQLTSLPILPDTLKYLVSRNNNILPPTILPKSLKYFKWSISYRNKNNQVEGERLEYVLD